MIMFARALRLILYCGGIAVVAWAYTATYIRDAEGFLQGKFCLPVAVGVAVILLGWSLTGRNVKFGLWFALGLVGQAVAVQMIDAGRLIHYQHYKPVQKLDTFLLVFFLVQTCAVGIGLKARWRTVWSWMRRNFRTWQFLGVGFVFVVSSAAPSREVGFYLAELCFATLVQAVNLGNIVLIVWALPREALLSLQGKLDRWFGPPGVEDREASVERRGSSDENLGSVIENPKPVLSQVEGSKIKNGEMSVEGRGSVDRFAVLAAIWVTVVAAMLSGVSYERHPHLQDEVVYLYHAQYLANGVLAMPAPPVPEAFKMYLMEIEKDRWYPSPPPGWPAILTSGVLLGVPWLVNPVLAGVNILLTFVLVGELYDRRAARLTVLLLALSPWYIFMAMNFMPHTFTLTCALFGAVMLAWSRRSGTAVGAGLGGAAAGIACLIRPLDGLIVGGILGLWAIGLGGRRLKVPALGAFVLGSVLVGAAVLPYNKALTGDPMVFPLMAYLDKQFGPKSNAMGFGPERGLGWALDPFPGHGPLDAIVNAQLNLFSLNIELFGWSTGSLLLMALVIFSGAMRQSDYLMLSVVVAVVAVYSLYWYSGGPDFGARYWYLVIVPSVALTISGIQLLERLFAAGSGAQPAPVLAAVLTLGFFALVNYFPWRAIDKYYHYLRMRPDIRYLASEYRFGKSIVLVRGHEFPDYASAAAYNPVDFSASGPLYALDRNPEVRSRVLQAYADRVVWVVEGPSLTGNGFKVVAGPVSAEALLQGEGKGANATLLHDQTKSFK